jgi:anti-anti-sigma factor
VPDSSPPDTGGHHLREQSLVVDIVDRDEIVVVTLAGEIDLDTVPILAAVLDNVTPDRHVVVDCAAVQFIDSTGLQLIISQLQRMTQAGGSLRLRHTSFPVRNVVEITGLIQLFEIDA